MRTRRHFLKTVIWGAATTGTFGCRGGGEGGQPIKAPGRPGRTKRLAGDAFETCHAVRDGSELPRAEVTASHAVVIVGGGPSGLACAHWLRDLDLLLLEKEAQLGGNCLLDEWQGVKLSTGGAFYTEAEAEIRALFAELRIESLPVQGGDALVVDGKPVTRFFQEGAEELPFAPKVRDDFRRSRDVLLALLKTSRPEDLDKVTFAELLEGFDPLLTRFWDRFGPSNWGAVAADTSGLVGAEAYTWAGGADDPRRTFPGGLAGGAQALAERLTPALADRIQTAAAVYAIERDKRGAVVRYFRDGEAKAVRGRVVIVALGKFYAQHVVRDLPAPQRDAMQAYRYEPFPVFNVCLTSPGPEPAYDNWFFDTPFTDFIPADWVLYAGRGPQERRTALTVYHPLPESRRKELLVDELVLAMADAVAEGLERHFPGTLEKIAEVRIHRRGHPMFAASPGRVTLAKRASAAFGPILFANSDSEASVPSFDGAVSAARRAVREARKLLRA